MFPLLQSSCSTKSSIKDRRPVNAHALIIPAWRQFGLGDERGERDPSQALIGM